MNFSFYGYQVRATVETDLSLAIGWSEVALNAGFWLRQEPNRQSYLVTFRGTALAFFQAEKVGDGSQVRLHWQPSPKASPKMILRGLTKLVPLIEKALALMGIKRIFFTSHSPRMDRFMRKKLGYRVAGSNSFDGLILAKRIIQ